MTAQQQHQLVMPVTVQYVTQFTPREGHAPALVLADGSVYYGDVDDRGEPHGSGIMLFHHDPASYRAGVLPRRPQLAQLDTSGFSDGDRYGGSWSRGLPDGDGILVTSTFTYQGSWSEGRPHGKGNMLYGKGYVDRMPGSGGFFDGGVTALLRRGLLALTPFDSSGSGSGSGKPREYMGDMDKVHLRHGYGCMTYYNGDVYEGQWVDNRRHGQGRLLRADGESYTGQWDRDRRHGIGRIHYSNGGYYKGSLCNDERDGEGVMSFAHGDEYFGHFSHDRVHGQGTMRYKNGDVYEGEWRDGARHGQGKYTLKRSAVTVQGSFVHGLVHGRGMVVYPGVSTFVGEFDRGERTHGTIFWQQQQHDSDRGAADDAATREGRRRCYQGEWKGEHMHGRGLLWCEGEAFYYGHFVLSKRSGAGNMRYRDGSEYSGEFAHDVRHGWGLLQSRDGAIAAGRWQHDVLVEGYEGEWDGSALNGVGHLTLSLATFFGCRTTAAAAAAAVSSSSAVSVTAVSGDGSSNTATTAAVPCVDFFGIFAHGRRDGAGILKLPVVYPAASGGAAAAARKRRGDKVGAAASDAVVRWHVVKGSWCADVLHCDRVVWAYPCGEVYVGAVDRGVRATPLGRLWLLDGSVYVGPWRHNAPCGGHTATLYVKNTHNPIFRYARSEAALCALASVSRGDNNNNNSMTDTAADATAGSRLRGLDVVWSFFRRSNRDGDGDGDVDNNSSMSASQSRRVLVGYRDHYALRGAWHAYALSMHTYDTCVATTTATATAAAVASPTSIVTSSTPAAAAAAASDVVLTTRYSTGALARTVHTADVAAAASSSSSLSAPSVVCTAWPATLTTHVPPPTTLTVGGVDGAAVVCYPSGVQVCGSWRGNVPALAAPHRPGSFYDAHLQWVLTLLLLPSSSSSTAAAPQPLRAPSYWSHYTPLLTRYAAACGWGPSRVSSAQATSRHDDDDGDAAHATLTSSVLLQEQGNNNNDDNDNNKAHATRTCVWQAPTQCCFCGKEFGFFRKATPCAVCLRASCTSCLHTLEANTTQRDVAALLTEAQALLQRVLRDTPPAVTTSSNVAATTTHSDNNSNSSDHDKEDDVHDTLPGATAEAALVCADCVRCILMQVKWSTVWVPLRLFASVLDTTPHAREHDARLEAAVAAATATTATAGVDAEVTAADTKNGVVDDAVTSVHDDVADAHSAAPREHSSSHNNNNNNSSSSTYNSSSCCSTSSTTVDDTLVVYRGYTARDVPHLYGEMWWGACHYYRGGFAVGRRSGYGVHVMANGERYVGRFARDAWHGEGCYVAEDGAVLQGRFVRGTLRVLRYHGEADARLRRHGRGVAYAADGSVYNGEWVHGVRHGTGMLILPPPPPPPPPSSSSSSTVARDTAHDGGAGVYSGAFVRGAAEGRGKFVCADSAYYGGWLAGYKHGSGVEVSNDGVLAGTWAAGGVLHGFCRVYDAARGEVYETTFRAGRERDDCFARPLMVDDARATSCAHCGAAFGLFLRRHHCRLCGDVFCDACSQQRAVLPTHFYTSQHHGNVNNNSSSSSNNVTSSSSSGSADNNNNGSSNNVAQRVCTMCARRLTQRRMLALRRYADGAVYAGCWSLQQWVSRGLYVRADGVCIVMNSAGQPLLSSSSSHGAGAATTTTTTTATTATAAATTADCGSDGAEAAATRPVDASPSRAVLDALPVGSSARDVDAFVVWWATMVSRCELRVSLDVPQLQRYYARQRRAAQRSKVAVAAAVAAAADTANADTNSSTTGDGDDDSDAATAAAAAVTALLACPALPDVPLPRLFVSLLSSSPQQQQQQQQQTVSSDEAAAAAVLRAARFVPAVMPRPPRRVGNDADTTLRAVDNNSNNDNNNNNNDNKTAAEQTTAPALCDYDLPDEVVLRLIHDERERRFVTGSDNNNDNNNDKKSSSDNDAAAVVAATATVVQRPVLRTRSNHVPLLPPTPAPPPQETNERVYWDAWTVRGLPALCGRKFGAQQGGSGSGSAAAVKDNTKEDVGDEGGGRGEAQLYYSCPFWRPVVPPVQEVIELGKMSRAQRLLLRSDEATPHRSASSSSDSSSDSSSSDSSSVDVGSAAASAVDASSAVAQPFAQRLCCGGVHVVCMLLPPLTSASEHTSTPFAAAAAAAASMTQTQQHMRRAHAQRSHKQRTQRNMTTTPTAAAAATEQPAWMPAAMHGPFRFDVRMQPATRARDGSVRTYDIQQVGIQAPS